MMNGGRRNNNFRNNNNRRYNNNNNNNNRRRFGSGNNNVDDEAANLSPQQRRNFMNKRDQHMLKAKECLAAGDRIEAENHFQHAEHYFRMANLGLTQRFDANRGQAPEAGVSGGEQHQEMGNPQEQSQYITQSQSQPQPQPQPQQRDEQQYREPRDNQYREPREQRYINPAADDISALPFMQAEIPKDVTE